MTETAAHEPHHVADQLIREILEGRYQPGDFIPKELEICRQSGLSRNVVRRHLGALVKGGVIERISGYGSRVREFSQWHILDPAVTDWITRFAGPHLEIQREILSFRLTVEPWVAMMAAGCATARDLVAIEEAFEGMQRHHLDEDTTQHDHCDVSFHVAIYYATHNIVWSQLSHVLRPSIHLLVSHSNTRTLDPTHSLESHRRLMEAIRMRQANEAYHAAIAVLEDTATTLNMTVTPAPVPHHLPLNAAPTD
ncbi:transcriptional regulator, GntR family [Kushneria avicenniae]|uniref:Transcriptional regulator, GntR family n=1 Tax=Kushneria avicenniae TaxID=402385 RepID=A0A1I1KU16_9GAMM|nr:FCD domain-containing protein [Kushneria avicenniae]SFC63762.1 transcriptional regulator, GntR family [Kushneria avicenniae]